MKALVPSRLRPVSSWEEHLRGYLGVSSVCTPTTHVDSTPERSRNTSAYVRGLETISEAVGLSLPAHSQGLEWFS